MTHVVKKIKTPSGYKGDLGLFTSSKNTNDILDLIDCYPLIEIDSRKCVGVINMPPTVLKITCRSNQIFDERFPDSVEELHVEYDKGTVVKYCKVSDTEGKSIEDYVNQNPHLFGGGEYILK